MNNKLKIAIISIIIGWLMIGIGYTTKIGHPTNTALFILGIICFLFGLIKFFISIKQNK